MMPKTYALQGPIVLENLSNTDALTFCATVINAIPSYSMGTASMHLKAQGPAGTGTKTTAITGKSVDELKAALSKAQSAPKAPEDITYDVRGRVNLIGLSLEDGIGVIEAAMNAIPGDSLVVTGMVAINETA
jgi:hypothetical protein